MIQQGLSAHKKNDQNRECVDGRYQTDRANNELNRLRVLGRRIHGGDDHPGVDPRVGTGVGNNAIGVAAVRVRDTH